MIKDIVNGIIIFLSLIIPMLGVFLFCLLDRFVDKKRKKIYILLVVCVISLIFQNFIEYYLIEYKVSITARTFISVYGYTIRPVIIGLFITLVAPEKKHYPVYGLILLNFLVYTTAFYSKLSISFSDDNHFIGGPLRFTCLVVSLILVAYSLIIILIEFRKSRKRDLIVPVILTIHILIGVFMDMFMYYGVSHRVDYITIMIVVVTLFYYIWLHIQFVYKHERDLLAQQKIQIALSQIKPHFIYNTLNAIQDIDDMPDVARDAIGDFARYLRENLDFLTSSNLISFNKELEHVKKYVNLEKLRFGDKINIIFDIKTSDFLIPSLSLQMVVENAIKHGITKKYDGGNVWVSSYEKDDKYFVVVKDDGIGFDVNKVIGANHLGFKNSNERLKHFVGGSLVIESEINKGTTVTLVIPKQKGEKQDESYYS